MAKDRSVLAVALRSSSSWVVSRLCVVVALAVVVLFSGLFWGLYSAPTPAVHVVNATVSQVETWATKTAKCASGGSASHMTATSNGYQYHCQGVRLGDKAYFTILIVLGALILMIASYPTDLTMLAATIIFVAGKVLAPADAFVGFSSTAVLSVASMFIVVKCLEENGSVDIVARLFLGKPKNLMWAMFRLCVPISIVSMFVLTTPLVAMMIPVVLAWCSRISMPPSKFLIPLSFACIIGGTCTVIGGSPNLVVVGLLYDFDKTIKFRIFDFMPVGAPATIVSVAYLVLTCYYLLPKGAGSVDGGAGGHGHGGEGNVAAAGTDLAAEDRKARKFFCAFRLLPKSPMVGFSVEKSGLLTARDLSLVCVRRKEAVYPYANSFVLEAEDVMVFYGLPEGIAQMRRDRTVELQMFGERILKKRYRRRLIECVISNDSPLIGVQLSDKVFQDHYQATVVGVRPSFKHGMSGGVTIPMRSLEPSTPSAEVTEVRLDLKETASTTSDVEHISIPHTSSSGSKSFVGIDDAMMSSTTSWNPNYRLLPGDAIVIEAHILLMHIHKNSDHFSLMREVSDSKPPISNDFMDQFRLYFGGVVLAVIIALSAAGVRELLEVACVGALVLVAIKSITINEAFAATQPRVLLTVISSFGIGRALLLTGLASWIAHGIVSATISGGAYWLIWGIWLVTSVLGCVVGAYAVVVIMFPICVEANSIAPQVSVKQFVVIMLMGASTAFVTPLGYVTSVMVQRVGHHTFAEFAKLGLVLQVAMGFFTSYLTMKYIASN